MCEETDADLVESKNVEFVGNQQVEALRNHIVGLVASSNRLGEMHLFSGFVLHYLDDWLWCSAGHCVEKIVQYIESGDADFRLNPLAEKVGLSVPFNPSGSTRRFLNEDRVDFGFLVLNDFYIRSLRAAGVVPIETDSVAYTSRTEGTFVLVGIPAESVELGSATHLGQEIKFTPIAVRLTRNPNDVESDGSWCMNFSFDRDLYIIEGKPLESAKGMSGSPIFAWLLDDQGKTRHVPIGIQHSWISSTNTIKATPMRFLTAVLELAGQDQPR